MMTHNDALLFREYASVIAHETHQTHTPCRRCGGSGVVDVPCEEIGECGEVMSWIETEPCVQCDRTGRDCGVVCDRCGQVFAATEELSSLCGLCAVGASPSRSHGTTSRGQRQRTFQYR